MENSTVIIDRSWFYHPNYSALRLLSIIGPPIWECLLSPLFWTQRDQGERGAAAERRHPAVGAGVQGEALRTDPAVQEQQQEGATATAGEKVEWKEGLNI